MVVHWHDWCCFIWLVHCISCSLLHTYTYRKHNVQDVALKEVRDIAKTTEVTQEGFVIVRCEQEARKQMSSHRILLNTVYTGSYNVSFDEAIPI